MEHSHMLAQPQQQHQTQAQSQSPSPSPSHSHPHSQSRLHSQAAGTPLHYLDYPNPSMMKVSSPPTFPTIASDFPVSSHLNVTLPPISLPQERSPSLSSYSDLPPTELPPIQSAHEKPAAGSSQSLPSLSSLTGSQVPRLPPIAAPSEPVFSPLSTTSTATAATTISATGSVGAAAVTPAVGRHWPNSNPFSAYYTPSYVQSPEPSMRMESPHGTSHQRATSVSLDDPGVRAAAEALGRLRTVDTMPHDHDARRNRTPERFQAGMPSNNPQLDEPLLQLITTSYPSIAPFAPYLESATLACNTAYIQSKNYSPAVIKGGAEYLEDRVVKPVAKTVGRYGGHGLRWWLQKPGRKQRQAPDAEDGRPGTKRRKGEQDDRDSAIAARVLADFDLGAKDRRTSVSTVDTLPAYDDHRSPAYTETADDQTAQQGGPSGAKTWISTSSLRVAMQDESRRKIRALLHVLKNANGSLTNGLEDLKKAVEEYNDNHSDNTLLPTRISKLAVGVKNTVALSVNVINKTTANALPDNVKDFITRHIMSLPQLTAEYAKRENTNVPGDSNRESTTVRQQANSALALAAVSLNVLSQISDALTATLEVAEGWCETQGRQDGSQPSSPLAAVDTVGVDGDVKMSG